LISNALNNREKIRATLQEKMKRIRERALLNGTLAAQLIQHSKLGKGKFNPVLP
jgi:hypothetical protein